MAESSADSLVKILDRYLTELPDSIAWYGAYPTHLDLSYDALEKWVTNVCFTLEGHNLKEDADRIRNAGMTDGASAESVRKNDRRGLLRKLLEAKVAELEAVRAEIKEHQSWSNALKERHPDRHSETHSSEGDIDVSPNPLSVDYAPDLQPEVTVSNKLFVVHGRNSQARDAMFTFLRAIGLQPIEWSQAVKATGKASPYIGEILDTAFTTAQAVVVLMTPDDVTYLREEFRSADDPPYESEPTAQARPNVLFEAGMAIGRSPNRTLLVELGRLRPFSDIGGRYTIRLNNSTEKRQELAQYLENAGCLVDLTGTDWHSAGDFAVSSKIETTRNAYEELVASGLTQEDILVLKLSYEKKISNPQSHVQIDKVWAQIQGESSGITRVQLFESVNVLNRKGYIDTSKGPLGPEVQSFGITHQGLEAYALIYVENYADIEETVCSYLSVREQARATEIIDELNQPQILIEHILEKLKEQGLIKVAKLGRIRDISPELKRRFMGVK